MYDSIHPGKTWLDTNGNRIQAHGASVYFDGGKYHWIGEDKSHTHKKGKIWTWGIRHYTSTDLMNWTDEGHLVEPEPDNKKSIFHPNRRMDRPHLLKNERTGKYVLWLKYCDQAHFAVLTANRLEGPYEIVQSFLQPYGRKAGDFDLAVDPTDGIGYLYVELDHEEVIVCKLNAEYTDVTGEQSVIYTGLKPPLAREGVTHFVHGGRHYLLTSGMTGYVPNPSEVAVGDGFMGPFHILGDPHVDDDSGASFNSQVSCVFKIDGSDTLVAVADRWVPEYVMTKEKYNIMLRAISAHSDRSVKVSLKDLWMLMTSPLMGSADTSIAEYVWLPIEFDNDMPRLRWLDAWRPEEIAR